MSKMIEENENNKNESNDENDKNENEKKKENENNKKEKMYHQVAVPDQKYYKNILCSVNVSDHSTFP